MNGLFVNLVVEGYLDQRVVEKVFAERGIKIAGIHGKQGKDFIMSRMSGYYHGAATAGSRWLVLLDLDDDNCAPEFLKDHSPGSNDNFMLRLAVRELESWLLADRSRIAAFLGVPKEKVPMQVESLRKPKKTIVDLARKSRKKDIRQDIPPQPGVSAQQGILYNSRMEEFVTKFWRVDVAERSSDSLRRFLKSLATWER
jgi:hypothetical protein